MPLALKVEQVSKQYRIYSHPTDRLKESLTLGVWKRHREFWALKNISFQIEAGTTTGIVGPNGSGKSTLLQIITGTLEPTHGNVWHQGRVSALLELGSGFNMEFTGVENVFMNGALLGLSRREVEKLLPEIERFAEIGQFIHQPVKTYSSGMYVRLAFSVAISVDPDLLIVDEALAVGDAIFQHRCTRRIREMQENGTTILVVSHDPNAVRALCSRAILLNSGRVEADGKPVDVLNRYQKIIMAREDAYEAEKEPAVPAKEEAFVLPETRGVPSFRHGDRSAEVLSVELLNAARQRVECVETGERLTVRMIVRFHEAVNDPVCGFLLRNRHGIHSYGTNTRLQRVSLGQLQPGDAVEVKFDFECWLAAETYSVTVAAHSPDNISFDWLDAVLFFRVMSATPIEGVANLNASASARTIALKDTQGIESMTASSR